MLAGIYTVTHMNMLKNRVMDEKFDVYTEAPEVINKETHILLMSKRLQFLDDLFAIMYIIWFFMLLFYMIFTEAVDRELLIISGGVVPSLLFFIRKKSKRDVKESFLEYEDMIKSKFGDDLYFVWSERRNKEKQ